MNVDVKEILDLIRDGGERLRSEEELNKEEDDKEKEKVFFGSLEEKENRIKMDVEEVRDSIEPSILNLLCQSQPSKSPWYLFHRILE